jgi:hypothetical protein
MTMKNVLTYFKKEIKPLAELLGTKQSCKSSYTILKGLLDEKHGKCVKTKINASLSKTRSFLDENHQ